MFPSSSPQSPPHPYSLHRSLSSSIHHHHQPRQSNLPDNHAYSQPLSQLSPPIPVRNPRPNMKKALPSGVASHRTTQRYSNSQSTNNTPLNNNTNNNDSPAPICANCGTQTTPLWRRNQSGETLCNACALFHKMKGRPRPISLKTNVIKPRNRIKAVDRIPFAPSLSHNQQQHQHQLPHQQHPILSARDDNKNLLDLSNHVVVSLNRKNSKYSPTHQQNVDAPTAHSPLHLHSFHSNPQVPHFVSSSVNSFHSPPSKTRFLDPNHLSSSVNNAIHLSSSQSPSSSQNSACSTRSTPQLQLQPIQPIRSAVSSRKSSPGGANQDDPIPASAPSEAKRRKYASQDLLAKPQFYERRISTGSIEPHHHQHGMPIRACSLAHTTLTLPSDSNRQCAPFNDSCDRRPSTIPLCHSSRGFHASIAAHCQQLSTTLSGHQSSVCMNRASPLEEDEPKETSNVSLTGFNRGKSTLRPSRITLPPLSQITQDFVPAFQLNPSPINFGPPLSFEASAREAMSNSPISSRHHLTIPPSLHQKKFEQRRAVSVISSVSDSESIISPARTASTSSRIHSPLDQASFPCNDGNQDATPPTNNQELKSKLPNFLHEYSTSREVCSGDSPKSIIACPMEKYIDGPKWPRVDRNSEKSEPQNELNQLKNRIIQLELINGAMENRINELENRHDEDRSDGASKTSSSSDEVSDESSSRPSRLEREQRRNSFGRILIDPPGPSDHDRWIQGSELEAEQLDRKDYHFREEEDQKEQLDQIEGSDDGEDDSRQ